MHRADSCLSAALPASRALRAAVTSPTASLMILSSAVMSVPGSTAQVLKLRWGTPGFVDGTSALRLLTTGGAAARTRTPWGAAGACPAGIAMMLRADAEGLKVLVMLLGAATKLPGICLVAIPVGSCQGSATNGLV